MSFVINNVVLVILNYVFNKVYFNFECGPQRKAEKMRSA